MNILVVGFGGMGCRHAQSILDSKLVNRISVVESAYDIYLSNLERIGAKKDQIDYFDSINKLTGSYDLAIVATSSQPRYEIIKSLIQKGIKTFIIEKIIFQSSRQFDEIINLLNENHCNTFCNLPNRYFNIYNEIRTFYLQSEISNFDMNVIGGDFGLTCNSVHYADLFSYISEQNLRLQNINLEPSLKPNRRGDIYKELVGSFSLIGDKNGHLNIVSNPAAESGVVVHITINNTTFILYENSQTAYCFSPSKTEKIEFEIIPTSKLTSVIITDIQNGNCRLPSVGQLYSIHAEFFKAFNPVFGLTNTAETLCPIT